MKYYPMHMHLHASHEPTASIGSHMAHSAALGIHHLWITEHDVRMGRKKRGLPEFYFPKRKLFVEFPNGVRAGFKHLPESTGNIAFVDEADGISLDITAKNGERELLCFYSIGKNHCDPLFSGVKIRLDADIALAKGAVFAVEIILSVQPPSFEHARLIYKTDIDAPYDGDNVRYLPMPDADADGRYTLEVTADATDAVGGLDNATCYIRLLLDGGRGDSRVRFRRFCFLRSLDFEPVRQEQIKVAEQVGKKWGVTPFVTYEISDAGHHKNCYTTSVPVLNYEKLSYEISHEAAVEYVLSHGGIFSYNHPFTEWKNAKLSDEEKHATVTELAERLAEERVYGASLIEVGFPYEKEDFYERHYLALWDGLSSRGVFITGDGDSDNHHATADGWTEGNNFVTFTGIGDDESPSEESFRAAFIRGSVWCGDPTRVGSLDMHAVGGAPMGSIFVGSNVDIVFSASGIRSGGYAKVVLNGNEGFMVPIENGSVAFDFTLYCEGRIDFARVELRDENDVLMALTNPIYTVKLKSDIYASAMPRLAK